MLSIIIPTYNRKETVKETLSHLMKTGELAGYVHEVIVINDGDVELDDIADGCDGLNIRIIKNIGRKGASAARNLGASLAVYDLLLFIDDDMLLNDGSIAQIIEFHRNHSNCLMSGSREYSPEIIEKMGESSFGRFMIEYGDSGMEGAEKNAVSENLYESKTLASFCLSMPKRIFELLGGFNENFPYAGCEDQEFTMRALEKNLKLYYLTSIKTFHNDLQTGRKDKWLNRQFTGVQGFPLLCELYPERKSLALFVENIDTTERDDLRLKAKKTFKKVAFGKAGFFVLATFTKVFEKASFFQPILNKCYRLMGGMMIYQGFQIGQRNLQKIENTGRHTQKNKLA